MMSPIAIITIIGAVLVVGGVLGTYIYRKIKHKPTGECACCHPEGKDLIKEYRKKYGNKAK